jgi:hypothetical protein
MINLNSIGLNSFNLELTDSPSWQPAWLAAGWVITLTNELQNVVKVVTIPPTPTNNSRFMLFTINGVATPGAEVLTPAVGQVAQVYFGKEGIGTWRWTCSSVLDHENFLAQGYLKVVSNNVATDEILKATFVSDNEDLQTIIYTS